MALPLLGREEPTTARVLQDALGTLLLPLRELEPHSISPRLEAKDTRGPRVAGGESESPGPGRTPASAAGRPARSPPNPHPGPVERADRYALPSGGPQSSRNRQGWEWGVGEGSPSRAGRAPPGSAARFPEPGRSGSGAGDAARPELGLASTYCSGACPAWRALLSPPRARPPPPPALKGREPGAGSAGRQRGWAARAPGDTRFRSLLPRAGAPGAPQGAGRRYAGRAPEEDAGEEGFRPLSGGSPSIRAARSVSRTPRAAWARSASGARCGAAVMPSGSYNQRKLGTHIQLE
ncbi:translation initiation factor IF-2-like [Ursus americanus]|uniref:translation initiation factor IF-2-like n=1 Tax=Ursus americanus TaxID=9643 RepID=UPI001E67DAFA|nr:translation initiation factor IF-2-like [Ursus americanus]